MTRDRPSSRSFLAGLWRSVYDRLRMGAPSIWDEPKVYHVSAALHWLAAQESPPQSLDAWRVQKLLYYLQGWSFALRNKPMFEATIKAWRDGPVVPVARKKNEDMDFQRKAQRAPPAELSQEDLTFIASVWSDYKGFSTEDLILMTHNEAPWMEVYVPDKNGHCSKQITDGRIRAYFASLVAPSMSNKELTERTREMRPPQSWYEEPEPQSG